MLSKKEIEEALDREVFVDYGGCLIDTGVEIVQGLLDLQLSRVIAALREEAEAPVTKDTAGKRKALHEMAARLEREQRERGR